MQEQITSKFQHVRLATVLFVAGLLAAALLVAVTTAPTVDAREGSHAVAAPSAEQGRAINIPDKAYRIARFAYTHNWSPPHNYIGGSKYRNEFHNLPDSGGHYKGYHIDPKGVVSQQRIVINTQTKGWWYTPNKYKTFRYVGELDNK
jgi:guanyl-specific ribonuclease Sa